MGREHASREKKLPIVIFFIFVHKNVYRIRFQKIKIGPLKGFEKKAFFSLLLMRKRLSGGQKWFLKPYFPLIMGMFVFRSGLRFSFRALARRRGEHVIPFDLLKAGLHRANKIERYKQERGKEGHFIQRSDSNC